MLVGIDLGGTKIEIAAINGTPEKILYRERIDTERDKGYDHILKQIRKLYLDCKKALNSDFKLGVAIPGSINSDGKVQNANLSHLNGKPLQQDLAKLLETEIFCSNDANCFILSEARFGAARGYNNALGLIMGTGFGAGIILDGKLVVGANGLAGELGHFPIELYGDQCWCGNHGCTELFLSGTGLEKLYFAHNQSKLSSQKIYQAYQDGAGGAVYVVNQFLDYYARAIANFYAALDPEVIVIGGGLSNLPILYDQGIRRVAEQMFSKSRSINIVPNTHGDSSGVFGAALLCK